MPILLYSFILLFTSTFSYANAVEKLVKDNEQSVFTLKCYNQKNKLISTSSGFFIDKAGLAISNICFLKEAYKAQVETADGTTYDVDKLVNYNPGLDIAKIQVKNPLNTIFPYVKISAKLYKAGDQVFTIDNQKDRDLKISSGTISALKQTNEGICYLVTSPLSAAEGAPVFNYSGEVIAITAFTKNTDNSMLSQANYAVNIGGVNLVTNQLNLPLGKSSKDIAFGDFVPTYMRAVIQKNYPSALDICSKEIAAKPSWLAYHYRAMVNMEINKFEEAEKDFVKALKLNNSTVFKEIDYIGLGKAYKELKRFDEAKESYTKALKVNLKSGRCHCELAELAEEWLGPQNVFVETSYKTALSIDSTSCPFGLRTLGFKHLSNHEFERAKYFLTRALEFETDKQGLLLEFYNLGNCNFELKEYAKAIESFQNCIRLMPDDFESSINIGLCYLALGRKPDAYASFKQAKQIVRTYNLGNEAEGKVSEQIAKHFRSSDFK